MYTLLDDFMGECSFKNKSQYTISNYNSDLKDFYNFMGIVEGENEEEILFLEYEDFESYITRMKNKGFKAATINRRIATLRSFYSFLMAKGYVQKNIPKLISKMTPDKQNTKFLEKDVAKDVLKYLEEKVENSKTDRQRWFAIRNKFIIATFLGTGMRVFELENLKTEDINIETGEVIIRKGKGNAEREVILPKKVLQDYIRWIEIRENYGIEQGNEDYVVISSKGCKMHKRKIQELVENISKETGVHIRCHMLRHTFATVLVENNVDIRSVGKALGHRQVATTEKIYVHGTKKDLNDCARHNSIFED